MKLQILPNWCKKLGLLLFFSFFILTAAEGFIEGFTGVSHNSEDRITLFSDHIGKNWLHVLEIFGIIGMLIYILSKEKIEDDYIDKLRYESYQFSSVIWLVMSILIYAFNEKVKLSLDYFIYLFIWTYLTIFFIKKRLY